MNKGKNFKTSDLNDIIKYASNMEHLNQVLINYEDIDNGIWNISFNLISAKGINIIAMIKNALLSLYKTYPITSYIMERDTNSLDITLLRDRNNTNI